jgi:adenylate kinase
MFRAECAAGTELGKSACAIISAGGFVEDDIVNRVVASRIARPDCVNGFLLDGYPRTVPQARQFAALVRQRGLSDPIVIHLDVADDALVARLTARRQCPECRRIYNLQFQPPRIAGQCDDCHAPLLIRDDDSESVIRRRLVVYKERTGPILDWYGESAVVTVDGGESPTAVRSAVEAAVLSVHAAAAAKF